MKKLAIIVFLFGAMPSAIGQTSDVISRVEPADFLEVIQKKEVQLIDVRTPEEFEEGHMQNALNIDFYADNFLTQFSQFDKEKPVYIYCRSGNRSGKAAKKLSAAGFNKIIDLKGGVLEMEKYLKEK